MGSDGNPARGSFPAWEELATAPPENGRGRLISAGSASASWPIRAVSWSWGGGGPPFPQHWVAAGAV